MLNDVRDCQRDAPRTNRRRDQVAAIRRRTSTSWAAAGLLLSSVAVQSVSAQTGNYDAVLEVGADFQAAVDAHPPGSSFLIATGVHRLQSVTPKDGMTFDGEVGAVMNGSRLLSSFQFDGTWYYVDGQTQEGYRNGSCESGYSRCHYPEDVFVDDVPLRHVAGYADLAPGTFYFDYAADRIYLGENPNGHQVETSVSPSAFSGPAVDVSIRGLVIEKYANPGQTGAIGPEGSGWLTENVEARLNHAGGIRLKESSVIRGCFAHHNGQAGILTNGADVLVEDNRIGWNNFAHHSQDWEAGGTKFAHALNAVIRRNWVHDNLGSGLWVDIRGENAILEDNVSEHNFRAGLHYEVSNGGIVRYNYMEANGLDDPRNSWLWASGILVAASRDVEAHDNVVVTNGNGITGVQQMRGSDTWGELCVTGLDVHHNTITMARGATGVAADYTPPGGSEDCSINVFGAAANNHFESNTYYVDSLGASRWAWNGGYRDFSAWQGFGHDLQATTQVISSEPPTWSGSVAVDSQSETQVALSWAPASDAEGVAAYRVYEDTLGQVATTSGSLSVTVRWLEPGITYSFRVEAVDVMGNESEDGPAVTATTVIDCGDSACAPSGLSALAGGQNSIELTWTDNEPAEVGYEVERSVDGSSWATLATLSADSESHTDSGLNAGSTFYYRVRAIGGSGPSPYSNVAQATTDSEIETSVHLATAETSQKGTQTNNFQATHSQGGLVETLEEIQSGGNPANQRSVLDHRWTIPVSGAGTHSLVLTAWATGAEGESFVISYATDGATFTDLLTVSGTSATTYVEELPALASGQFTVRALDSDRTRGNSALDSLHVDYLAVETIGSPGGPGDPPTAPSNPEATATSTSQIALSWTDTSDNELGFAIERSEDSSSFSEIARTAANTTSYQDTNLTAGTTYYYRFVSYNAEGSSAPSSVVQATTNEPSGGIELAASGSKEKGKHIIALSWSGSSASSFTVWRDGQTLATVSGQSYTDNTNNRGGRTYTYRVCEAPSGLCSAEVQVNF